MLSPARVGKDESIIRIRALGLTVRVRAGGNAKNDPVTVIETTNAAGGGLPLWRRAEAEIFQILTGRYLFEVDGRRFIARRGDLVSVPTGAARAFVNVTGTGGRQQVIISPGIDAAAFFRELAQALEQAGGEDDSQRIAALRDFSNRWGVEILDAPLSPDADGPSQK